MPIQQYLLRPAGVFPMGSNQSPLNDSQQHKQLISIRTKSATASWPQNNFPTLTDARNIYMEIQVIFESHKLPIVQYDDLQGATLTLPSNLDPNNDEVVSASSILYGFLSFNAQSNSYIQAILLPYSHLNDGKP